MTKTNEAEAAASGNAVSVLMRLVRPYLQHTGECGQRWKVGDFEMPCTCGLEELMEAFYANEQ